jgi:predicted nucleic acid-binding protein
MELALLDTDILSEVLKAKDVRVLDRAQQYLSQHDRLSFSAVTYYEVVRGMHARRADRQLARFLQLANDSDVIPISIPILTRAAELWAIAHSGGHPRDDADLIIASTALEVGSTLVSGNTTHFQWIQGLRITDWRQS